MIYFFIAVLIIYPIIDKYVTIKFSTKRSFNYNLLCFFSIITIISMILIPFQFLSYLAFQIIIFILISILILFVIFWAYKKNKIKLGTKHLNEFAAPLLISILLLITFIIYINSAPYFHTDTNFYLKISSNFRNSLYTISDIQQIPNSINFFYLITPSYYVYSVLFFNNLIEAYYILNPLLMSILILGSIYELFSKEQFQTKFNWLQLSVITIIWLISFFLLILNASIGWLFASLIILLIFTSKKNDVCFWVSVCFGISFFSSTGTALSLPILVGALVYLLLYYKTKYIFRIAMCILYFATFNLLSGVIWMLNTTTLSITLSIVLTLFLCLIVLDLNVKKFKLHRIDGLIVNRLNDNNYRYIHILIGIITTVLTTVILYVLKIETSVLNMCMYLFISLFINIFFIKIKDVVLIKKLSLLTIINLITICEIVMLFLNYHNNPNVGNVYNRLAFVFVGYAYVPVVSLIIISVIMIAIFSNLREIFDIFKNNDLKYLFKHSIIIVLSCIPLVSIGLPHAIMWTPKFDVYNSYWLNTEDIKYLNKIDSATNKTYLSDLFINPYAYKLTDVTDLLGTMGSSYEDVIRSTYWQSFDYTYGISVWKTQFNKYKEYDDEDLIKMFIINLINNIGSKNLSNTSGYSISNIDYIFLKRDTIYFSEIKNYLDTNFNDKYNISYNSDNFIAYNWIL